MIAPVLVPGRKVRTPQGTVVLNRNAGKPGESATENTPPMGQVKLFTGKVEMAR
jgi:hypothetical protein